MLAGKAVVRFKAPRQRERMYARTAAFIDTRLCMRAFTLRPDLSFIYFRGLRRGTK
jgi:hypothetical protein